MIKIALIDDHQIVRSGFAQLLNLEPDLRVVAEFGSAADALAGLPGSGVQLCVCDISMPDQSGLDLLRQLPAGLAVVMADIAEPTCIRRTVASAGGQMGDVIKLVQYFRNLDHFPYYSRVRKLFYPDQPPVSTVVQVSEMLPDATVLIEVEATVWLPQPIHSRHRDD